MRRATGLLFATVAALALLPLHASAHGPGRAVGVYVDPWHIAHWARDVGFAPQFTARFEAFSRTTPIEPFLREAERQGLRRVMITWEPWRPVPAERGVTEQFRAQPGYTNREIAAGAQDAYVSAFARSLAGFRGRVDLRYAHEMNGTWYPWSRDPIGYRRAWRHVVRVFRAADASNVRFVFSPNPSLYLRMRTWRRSVRVYWPGRRWVDAVGSTMIDFGGVKRYAVKRFEPRLVALRELYRKPVHLTEVSTAHAGRMRWLRDLRGMLRRLRWIRAVAWFQHRSRGQQQIPGSGRLDWDVREDPEASAVLRGIHRDGLR